MRNICVSGKTAERYPVCYFTVEGETEEDALKNIKKMTKEEIEKQNMERVNANK